MKTFLLLSLIVLSAAGIISTARESDPATRSELLYRYQPENPLAIHDGVWKGYVIVYDE